MLRRLAAPFIGAPYDMSRHTQRLSSPRRRLLLGVVLLIIGACLLAANLGFRIHTYVWQYWPFLLIAVGGLQLAWPGKWDERRGGYWLFVVGIWGAINTYEWFGMHWGNSLPIFIIALGIHVFLGGLINSRDRAEPPTTGSAQ